LSVHFQPGNGVSPFSGKDDSFWFVRYNPQPMDDHPFVNYCEYLVDQFLHPFLVVGFGHHGNVVGKSNKPHTLRHWRFEELIVSDVPKGKDKNLSCPDSTIWWCSAGMKGSCCYEVLRPCIAMGPIWKRFRYREGWERTDPCTRPSNTPPGLRLSWPCWVHLL